MARFSSLVLYVAFAATCSAYPGLVDSIAKRQINVGQLASSYDYIIVGGGQSGLVIANRLSEDSSKTVLVVEYGYIDNNPAILEPSSATQYPARSLFNATTVAQPGIGNRQGTVYAASVVGGGSTVNGMMFDRGSAEDYDNWEKMGNPGWGWAGLLPYFKKSTKFVPPDPAIAQEYNITWDVPSAYGTDGPIEVTYPPWQWPGVKNQFKAWNEVGVPTQYEHGDGRAYNAFWVPSNVDQQSRRSYARNEYFDPVANRRNLQLLTGYRVNEVLFDSNKRAESVRIQARGTANGASTITVKANTEIILTAGWLHTPQILQRSGIGPRALLTSANIPVLVDLPGVGSNLQDHPAAYIQFQYSRDVSPNPGSLQSDANFRNQAQQQWTQNRKGPLSFGVGNSLATIPLPIFHPGYQATITKAQSQNAASFLPRTYTPEQVAGYVAQRDVLMDSFASLTNGLTEIPFSGGASSSLVLEKPLSRGTVLLNTADKYAEPVIDYNTNINPVDADLIVAMVKFYRRYMNAPSNQALGPQERNPGSSVTSDSALLDFVSRSTGSSTAHSCCTAAMMPRNQGGVVGPDLLVYGVTGLSVADISIQPLIPATHPCATVYATAEKAADVIKARQGTQQPPVSSSSSVVSSSTSTSSVRSSTTTTSTTSTTTTSTRSTTSTTAIPTPTPPPAGPVIPKWGQCAGVNWTGSGTCASGSTCRYQNPYYSQCL